MKNKRGLELEQLGKAIIFILVLVLLAAGLWLFSKKGISLVDFIKNLF